MPSINVKVLFVDWQVNGIEVIKFLVLQIRVGNKVEIGLFQDIFQTPEVDLFLDGWSIYQSDSNEEMIIIVSWFLGQG